MPFAFCSVNRVRLAAAASLAFVVAGLAICPAHAEPLNIQWVTVGDPNNAADTTGYGAVADSFRIMKFEFTNLQYAAFLNAVDPSGSNPFSIHDSEMGDNVRGGITNTGTANGSRYAVKVNMGDKPVNFVSWYDTARVANWLQNGQGTGSTETGAYTLGGATGGIAPAKNPGATFYIPTENEWYKAAYYKGGSTNAGYWVYPTQSNTAPTAVTADSTGIGTSGSTGNFANYDSGADWNGLDGNVTTVGTNGGPSAYGAFDMGGNVVEWNDLTGLAADIRGTRSCCWDTPGAYYLSSEYRHWGSTGGATDCTGIRLAAVPEPSTCASLLAGLACGCYSMWRRRKRA